MRTAPTTTILAAQLGCTRRTVSTWLKRPDSPGRTATGGFNVQKWKTWVADSGIGSRTGAAERDPRLDPLRREKLRLQSEVISLQTTGLELANKVARGELYSEQEVCRVVGNSWGSMISALRQMKHKISSQICGLDSGAAEKVLRADMLESLSRFEIPAGMEKHAFFGPIRQKLAELRADLTKEGL